MPTELTVFSSFRPTELWRTRSVCQSTGCPVEMSRCPACSFWAERNETFDYYYQVETQYKPFKAETFYDTSVNLPFYLITHYTLFINVDGHPLFDTTINRHSHDTPACQRSHLHCNSSSSAHSIGQSFSNGPTKGESDGPLRRRRGARRLSGCRRARCAVDTVRDSAGRPPCLYKCRTRSRALYQMSAGKTLRNIDGFGRTDARMDARSHPWTNTDKQTYILLQKEPIVYHWLPLNIIQYLSVPLDHSMIVQQGSVVLSTVN